MAALERGGSGEVGWVGAFYQHSRRTNSTTPLLVDFLIYVVIPGVLKLVINTISVKNLMFANPYAGSLISYKHRK